MNLQDAIAETYKAATIETLQDVAAETARFEAERQAALPYVRVIRNPNIEYGCSHCGCPSPLLPNELGPHTPALQWYDADAACPLCGVAVNGSSRLPAE